MAFFPTSKIFLEIGPFTITWYAICSLGGAFLCYYLTLRTLRKMGYKDDIIENFFIMMLPIAYIGARIWYCIFEWKQYAANPISVFYIWEGGLAIHGGIFAAVLFGLYYFNKHSIDGLRVADAAFPNVLLGQVIGRWGNFINQEAFGSVVSAEYMSHFPKFIQDGMYINGEYHMPTFLYEGVGNLIGFFLIRFVFKKYGRKKRGDMAYAYFIWYGMVRFIVEGLRTDSLMLGGIRVAQLVSICGMIFGLLGLMGCYDKWFKNIYPFKKQKPVILFDLDGTLLDTEPLIRESFKRTFEHYDPSLKLSEEEYKGLLGPTLKQSFSKYLPNCDLDEVIAYYRAFNNEHHDEYVRLYDGAYETVKQLKEMDYDIGVVSNKVTPTVMKGLEFANMKEFFSVVISCEEMEAPKPDPKGLIEACGKLYRGIDNLIYVGDSPTDIQTCKNMSAFSVAVLFDEARQQQLLDKKPCAVIHEFPQLLELLQEDREWSDFSVL